MFPLESERFALPQPERQGQGHDPAGTVTSFGHDLEKSLHLTDGVRLGFLIRKLRCLGQQYRVPRKAPAAYGFVERVADRAVNVVRGSGG